jgi:hypothetical protein
MHPDAPIINSFSQIIDPSHTAQLGLNMINSLRCKSVHLCKATILQRRGGFCDTFPPSYPRRCLSSVESELPGDVATIIQGPSLLTNTNVYRPSPSVFFLPGLRSLPFWTAPPTDSGDPTKVQIAYGDP